MGKLHFDTGTEKNPLSGKGFYVALAICLVAVGGVVLATVMGSSEPPVSNGSSDTAVHDRVSGVPDTRTTASTVKTTRTTRTTTTTTTSTTATATKPTAATAGGRLFVPPLSNDVVQPYSGNKLVYSETLRLWRTHNGTDFGGDIGQEVRAAGAGTVLSVTEDVLWGGIVEIEHGGGIISRYCGVTASVKKGDGVTVGQAIGTLSAIPSEAENTHLHFEILQNGKYVDPMSFIGTQTK